MRCSPRTLLAAALSGFVLLACAQSDGRGDTEGSSTGGALTGFTGTGGSTPGFPGPGGGDDPGDAAGVRPSDASSVLDTGTDAGLPEDASRAPDGPTAEACAPATPCGRLCADLETDPLNCGACGRTCVVPNANAACVAGECAPGACAPGFRDTNGLPDDGCEAEVVCAEGSPCATACGTEGRLTCAGGDAPRCAAPAELCNGVDDDCDGACDAGSLPGCRVPVHRGIGDGHLYTTDLAAVQSGPFQLEAADYFHLYREGVQGMRPVFLCRKGDGKRFLTSDQACEIGVAPEIMLGFWAPDPLCGAIPLYRLYSPASNDHFYTTSVPERDNAVSTFGYLYESVAGHVWTEP